MNGNWHLVAQQAQDRHEEMLRAAARERATAAVAGPSLREWVARALARRDHEVGSAPTTMPARSLAGAGR
jgi:hypothetical protein